MTFKRDHWLLPLGLLVLSLTWGYTWVIAKQGLSFAPPLAFAAERCVGGALALLIVLKLLGKPLKLIAPWPTAAIGLAQVTGFMLLQNWALVEGGPGKTAVLIYTMPIWTLILAWPLLGERIRGGQWIAALSTLAGLLLIIEPWNMHSSLFSKFLGVMAALCWAIGTILIKRLRAKHKVDLLSMITWQMIIGTIPLVILAAVIPEPATQWTMSYTGILIFMSVISTAFCWWLWITLLDRVPAWEASLSVLGTPVVAIVSARIMMKEEFLPGEVAGILLIGTGLALLSLIGWVASRRKQPGKPVKKRITVSKRKVPTKDELALLEPFHGLELAQIHVPSTADEFATAAADIKAAGIAGFDTESRPTFIPGEKSDGPHLVQFALHNKAYLFQLHHPACRPYLIDLLQSRQVIKAGFGLKSDRRLILSKLGIQLQGTVDLDVVFSMQGYPKETGVRSAVGVVLKQRFAKSRKTSTTNWSQSQLSTAQMLYAANDAYAALKVLEALNLPSAELPLLELLPISTEPSAQS